MLDTPGYFDFVGEVEEAVSAADAAVIVVSGKAGVEVGTEKAWELCDKYKLPRMVYVTEMDVDDASFRQVVEDLTASDLASITSHIHSWVFFLLWLHPFILSGVISPLISSSILGPY